MIKPYVRFILFTLCSAAVGLLATACSKSRSEKAAWVNAAPEDRRVEHIEFPSNHLGHSLGVSIYLPPGYSSELPRPVIYYLHGTGGDETSDVSGFLNFVLPLLKQLGLQAPIVVFPNGGMDRYRGKWAEMFVSELIPYIDQNYATRPEASFRLLAGFSIGGNGAVRLSAGNPGLFSGALSWGGGIRHKDAESLNADPAAATQLKASDYSALLINGEHDRPGAYNTLTDVWQTRGVPYHSVTLPDTKHNLGHYFERSRPKVQDFLRKYQGSWPAAQ